MRSHFSLPQGAAATCAVAGALTMLNGNCSAQSFIAADYATNSTYAQGWSETQNGGYGFGPWSMSGTESTSPNEHDMDRTSPFNPFGVAWTLFNPEGTTPGPANSWSQCVNPPTGSDISRAGRAIPGGLKVGQTFSAVISNPTTRTFFRGYTIVLSTGSDNIAYGQVGQQISVGCFEYHTLGNWSTSAGLTSLFDTDTATNGMQVDITLTSTNTFHAVMTPLDNPASTYSTDGNLENKGLTDQGEVNWVTYQLYNTDSNFYPGIAPCDGLDRTDFYIKSMTIAGFPLNIHRAGANVVLSWSTNVPGFNLESTPSLSIPVWNPVSPTPVIVNDQNVVTNAIAGAQQYYRLRMPQ
jgi:hypothetical protein